MTAVRNLTGQKFGRLTVMSRNQNREGGIARWNCVCDCGNQSVVRRGGLTNGDSTSCGCAKIRHGHAIKGKRSAEYKCWDSMLRRCENPSNPAFENYGGRGISVCDRWHIFENFLADMGRKPSPDLTIERVKNYLGYYKENCVWATRIEQLKNRRPYKKRKDAGKKRGPRK
jgi:hypothetical protein